MQVTSDREECHGQDCGSDSRRQVHHPPAHRVGDDLRSKRIDVRLSAGQVRVVSENGEQENWRDRHDACAK